MAGIPGQPTASPKDIVSPVPGAAAQDAFEAGPQAQVSTPAADQSSSQATPDAFAAGPDGQAAAPPVAPEQQGLGMKVLDGAGRVLDYPGGFMRAGLASAAGEATGNGMIVTPDDLAKAAVGKGPNTAEYLKRLGVSEGGSLNMPGLGRVTLRGAEGLALDIATDPLTLVAKTAKAIPYINKLLEVPGKVADALGEAVYKSAITAKDSEVAAKAGQAVIEQGGGVVASQAAMAQKISDTASIMGQLRQGLYDKFTQLGGALDMPEGMFKNAQGVLKNLRMNPTLEPLANEFEAMINKYQGQGFATIDQMSKWKTQLYDSLPKNAFNGPALGNPGKMFKAALARDFKTAIVDGGNKLESGLGDAIDQINDKWGALLEAKPTAAMGGGSLGKSIDALALISGGVPTLLKKKALEMATGPFGKTLVGTALMNAGQKGFMNSLNMANAGVKAATDTEQ